NTYTLKLEDENTNCTTYELSNCTIRYSPSCAWSLRPVNTMKPYLFFVSENVIHIRSAFQEQMQCRITTLDGRILLHETMNMQAGEERSIAIPTDLPVGMYAISIHGLLWKETYLFPKTDK
ncbi:MAG: hypothetical protein ACKO0Y_04150, partial [Bacteroidota bacterium]